MRIVLAGASGMLGTAVKRALVQEKHDILQLVRRRPTSPHEHSWDPASGRLEAAALEGADAVINFSGCPILKPPRRWSSRYRRALYSSRLEPTRTLAQTMASMSQPPKLFLSQSGSNYYGAGGPFQETSRPGSGFLADLCQAWEEAARACGTRVILMRTGVVLGPDGGAVAKLLLPLRLGLGGRIGDGAQRWPWISERDLAAAVLFLLTTPGLRGPVNLCAPQHNTVNAILGALAAALHRPLWLPVPGPLLRLTLGQAADEVLLMDSRLVPETLLKAGFTFTDTHLQSAADWLVGLGS